MARLETSFSTQYKRLYYRPKGRTGSLANQPGQPGQLDDQSGQRYKTLLSDPVMLQRLIYVVSETFERRQENTEHVDEANLLLRYIKHLVLITMARNSFHVAIGVSRLLYHYNTVEAAAIFQQLLPGTQRPRDESYWRVRKGLLLKELKERFGERLQLRRGASGEERFLAHQDSGRWNWPVEKCLEAFTPWETPCLLANLPMHDQRAIEKKFNIEFGTDSSTEENQKEEMRLHALIHPHCFAGLTLTGGFGSPAARLEVPIFMASGHSNSDDDSLDRTPAKLTDEELDLIRQPLDKQSQLRRNVSPDSLRILINGFERARWMPSETGNFNFEITDKARTLEIRTDQAAGDLLLAHHLFDFEESKPAVEKKLNIVLEGGQRLSLTLTPPSRMDATDESGKWQVAS
ncbi:MAG: hypothetical protein ACKVZH_19360 [Blastocatellia bacterium]